MNFKLKNKSILLYKQNKREYLIEMPHYHYLFFKLLFFIKNFKKQIMIKKIKKTKLITRILNPILITRCLIPISKNVTDLTMKQPFIRISTIALFFEKIYCYKYIHKYFSFFSECTNHNIISIRFYEMSLFKICFQKNRSKIGIAFSYNLFQFFNINIPFYLII